MNRMSMPSEKKIKHFILTRFNVASPGREQAIRLRPGWLDGRFSLFEEYCLPSVAQQSRGDFEWIIFFDTETPKTYREKIHALQSRYPFKAEFTPLFDMKDIVPGLVAKSAGADLLLTTRLDSDDILANDHVERLRTIVSQSDEKIINFNRGAILSVEGGRPRLYLVNDHSNPFASMIEPAGAAVKTIWGEKHVDIEKLGQIHQEHGQPAWLQVVHGGNVSNRIKGIRVPLQSLTEEFPYLKVLAPADGTEGVSINLENRVVRPLRHVKEAARAGVKWAYYKIKK